MLKASTILSLALGLALAATPGAAFAHTGFGEAHGFGAGFAHPLGGIDHMLAMVAVGVFAAHLGGRALWAVPATFVAVMALGGLLGMSGVQMPFAETGIGVSVIALGLAVAFRWDAPVALAMAFAGLFAIFHGHAHGAEMPEDASGAAYAAGFLVATALLHLAGIGLGMGVQTLGSASSARAARIGGGGMSLAGTLLLAGVL